MAILKYFLTITNRQTMPIIKYLNKRSGWLHRKSPTQHHNFFIVSTFQYSAGLQLWRRNYERVPVAVYALRLLIVLLFFKRDKPNLLIILSATLSYSMTMFCSNWFSTRCSPHYDAVWSTFLPNWRSESLDCSLIWSILRLKCHVLP